MTGARRARRALLILAIVIAGLACVAIRQVHEGRHALGEADIAAERGQLPEAIAGWETAARRYLPLAPHVDAAYERLVELAGHDPRYALPAWRAVRSAALATRHLWTPHAEELAAANAAIAELASRDPEGAPAAGADAATRKIFHAGKLARDVRPGPGAILLALAGIACWIAGVGLVIRRGFDARGRLARRSALAGVVLAGLGLAGWAIGAYVA